MNQPDHKPLLPKGPRRRIEAVTKARDLLAANRSIVNAGQPPHPDDMIRLADWILTGTSRVDLGWHDDPKDT